MRSMIKGPYLQWTTLQSMTIVWETTTAATGEVSYFETMRVHADGNGRFHTQEATCRVVMTNGTPACIQQVTLTGLQPETLYHYRVRAQNGDGETCESELLPFKTAVNPETPFCFAVTSETGGPCSDGQAIQIASDADEIRWLTQEGRILKKNKRSKEGL